MSDANERQLRDRLVAQALGMDSEMDLVELFYSSFTLAISINLDNLKRIAAKVGRRPEEASSLAANAALNALCATAAAICHSSRDGHRDPEGFITRFSDQLRRHIRIYDEERANSAAPTEDLN